MWDKEDFEDERKFVYYLTDTDKQEIDNALQVFKGESFKSSLGMK